MSYFEYVISSELTPAFEEKTKEILERINNGTAFYTLYKYVDEELTSEKKTRTIYLHAPFNIWVPLYDFLKGEGINFMAFHRQRVI